MEMTHMPWGIYKGKKIEDLPSWYLKIAACWDEKTKVQKAVVKACDDEYQWREKNNCHTNEEPD